MRIRLRAAAAYGCCWMILAAVRAGAADTASPQTSAATTETAATCQGSGWDMTRELKAFAQAPQSATAGSSISSVPVLRADTLYALRLRAQAEVQFAQPLTRPGRAVTPMAGMMHFTVLSTGMYRVTLDSPLWIDVVTAKGVLAPTAYTGWHECSVFRKSVDYMLEAGEAVTLQFSDAATDLVKLTIEPPPSA